MNERFERRIVATIFIGIAAALGAGHCGNSNGAAPMTDAADMTHFPETWGYDFPCVGLCAPGALECYENGYRICGDADGNGCHEWGDVTACDGGEVCEDGECILKTCEEECEGEIKICSGEGYQVCGNFDSDPCREWSKELACDDDTYCVDGSCVPVRCESECFEGDSKCISPEQVFVCSDEDGNGCYEWNKAPACDEGQVCFEDKCCSPECTAAVCGDDGCGGLCGDCGPDEKCTQGTCVPTGCIPSCQEVECGGDGCGGNCGICGQNMDCKDGKCVPVCAETCTFMGCDCGEVCNQPCGECPPGWACMDECHCQCQPQCTGKECGSNGCGGSCGTCPDGLKCESGQCVPCEPDCEGIECGDDGCQGNCGSCDSGEWCGQGKCISSTDVVLVPAGSFFMGCNETVDDYCHPDEYPYHEVYLDVFEIDAAEVTVAQYQLCVEQGACSAPPAAWVDCTSGKGGKEEFPVNCVDWHQAKAYCEWMGKRLCTEAEWEKAARGTQGLKYPWGNETATCQFAVMNDGSGSGCGTGWPMQVGSKPSGVSPYGAVDMSANITEWVADSYDANYYEISPPTNPLGPGFGAHRALRGGAFGWSAENIRASRRDCFEPDYLDDTTGFRCCK